MAIRKNTNPHPLDLNPELQDILIRNGLQGRIMATDQGFMLVVQGHDSPVLSYSINEQQMRALTSWGNNTDNKRAYNTLTSLIGNDFFMPRDFVHARNANGRVAMGLHGYRIGVGDQSCQRGQSRACSSYAERSRLTGESQFASKRNVSEAVSRATEVQFNRIQMVKDDEGKWALLLKAENEPSFAIYPDKDDCNRFFATIKQGNNVAAIAIRNEMAQKYYALANANPELKNNLFYNIPEDRRFYLQVQN